MPTLSFTIIQTRLHWEDKPANLSMLEETAIYQLNADLPVYKAGERYVGVTNTTKDRDTNAPWGYIGAVDPMTGKSAWRMPLKELPSWSGKLVTAGGLIFSGLPTGEFLALDESTGKVLWQFKTPSAMTRCRSRIPQ